MASALVLNGGRPGVAVTKAPSAVRSPTAWMTAVSAPAVNPRTGVTPPKLTVSVIASLVRSSCRSTLPCKYALNTMYTADADTITAIATRPAVSNFTRAWSVRT